MRDDAGRCAETPRYRIERIIISEVANQQANLAINRSELNGRSQTETMACARPHRRSRALVSQYIEDHSGQAHLLAPAATAFRKSGSYGKQDWGP